MTAFDLGGVPGVDKPEVCYPHGVIIWSGECPDCVEEGVAVMQPAPDRTPFQRAVARAVLLARYAAIRNRRTR